MLQEPASNDKRIDDVATTDAPPPFDPQTPVRFFQVEEMIPYH